LRRSEPSPRQGGCFESRAYRGHPARAGWYGREGLERRISRGGFSLAVPSTSISSSTSRGPVPVLALAPAPALARGSWASKSLSPDINSSASSPTNPMTPCWCRAPFKIFVLVVKHPSSTPLSLTRPLAPPPNPPPWLSGPVRLCDGTRGDGVKSPRAPPPNPIPARAHR
jgi:hypothetical protein